MVWKPGYCTDCKQNKNEVDLCNGDLRLCRDCNERRFPSLPNTKTKADKKHETRSIGSLGVSSNHHIGLDPNLRVILPAERSSPVRTPPPPKLQCVSNSCTKQESESGSIECSLCAVTYHKSCVGMKGRKPNVWFCILCKRMSTTVSSLKGQVKELETKAYIQDIRITEQDDKINEQERLIKSLQEENATLKAIMDTQKVISPNDEATESTDKASDPVSNNETTKTLLIGDSILRDINERGLDNTKVECLRGKKAEDIQQKLKETNIHEYGTVVIHGSTNDCTSIVNEQLAEMVYEEIIDDLNTRSPSTAVVISTICPRDDNSDHQENVDKLNDNLRNLAETKGCILVDNDMNFKLRNNNPDVSALDKSDRLHLSKIGTKRLISNINESHHILKPTEKTTERPKFNRTGSGKHQKNHRQQYRRNNPDHRPVQGRYTRGFANSSPRSCHYCGESNHVKRNCRFGQPLICYTCNEFGHKSNMCPFAGHY